MTVKERALALFCSRGAHNAEGIRGDADAVGVGDRLGRKPWTYGRVPRLPVGRPRGLGAVEHHERLGAGLAEIQDDRLHLGVLGDALVAALAPEARFLEAA